MLIQIHVIQNHSASNLNRDDLGAPKTCYFGGTLRARISSQSIKRSIRFSDDFKQLLGGIRTRRLAELITQKIEGNKDVKKRAASILKQCGIDIKEDKDFESGSLVYISQSAVDQMVEMLKNDNGLSDAELAKQFSNLILNETKIPDMALTGRMLETGEGILKNSKTKVEASLQVSHAFSTHTVKSEVDYYIAADDIEGNDAGAGFIDEALFNSACYYKYFSIDFEELCNNLGGNRELAAHSVGAFIKAIGRCNPTGKQNSFAAHNPPDGIMIELNTFPINYANAFAKPVEKIDQNDYISESILKLASYVHDIETGYGAPEARFWFSPNNRFALELPFNQDRKSVNSEAFGSLEDLISKTVEKFELDWEEVQKTKANNWVK